MVLTVFELVLFAIPFCFGRIMDSPPAQDDMKLRFYTKTAQVNHIRIRPWSSYHSGIKTSPSGFIQQLLRIKKLGKGKIYLPNKDASKRTLQPTLNIRDGPNEFLDIMAGDNKFLECEAGGTPPPTIHWLKDGQKIPQNLYEAVHSTMKDNEVIDTTLGLGFTRSRLFIDCATPNDAGRYTCVAENDYIRTFKSSQVFVADTLKADNDALCLAKKTFGSPARIHMWTHTRLEMIGSDVQLFCRPNGDPHPHVVWRGPNYNVLNKSKKYEFLPNGDLIIRKILWSDMGGYSCETKNSEGSDEALVFLYPTMPESEADV